MNQPKNIHFLLLAIISLVITAGCTKTITTFSNTEKSTNTNDNTEVNTNTTVNRSEPVDENVNAEQTTENDTIDTSNWLTYTNEEYGFSFMYPGDWTVETVSPVELRVNNDLGEDIKFYKQIYAEAGTNDTLLFSQGTLKNLKSATEKNGILNSNGVVINSYYNYSVPGGNFYKGADTFIRDDYLNVSLSLSSESQVKASQDEKVNDVINQFEAGEGFNVNDQELVLFFDAIIDTVNID